METITPDIVQTDDSTRKFLLSETSFALLTDAQRKIKETTEMTPALRKLINELVTPESVEKLTQKYIDKLS